MTQDIKPWLGTISGKRIDLLDPDPEQICIKDIATALSYIPRFNGHLFTHYSVAEHSVLVSSLVAREYKLQALLHDATEAYLCDIPSPLKLLLGDAYKSIETRLANAISEALDVDIVNLPSVIKQADMIALMSEHETLQTTTPDWGYDLADGLRCTVPYGTRTVRDAANTFTSLYSRYKKEF